MWELYGYIKEAACEIKERKKEEKKKSLFVTNYALNGKWVKRVAYFFVKKTHKSSALK